MAQGVKDPVFSLLWLGLLLWRGFHPWLGTSTYQGHGRGKKKKNRHSVECNLSVLHLGV